MRTCTKCGKTDTEETAKDWTAFASTPDGIQCLDCAWPKRDFYHFIESKHESDWFTAESVFFPKVKP